MRNFIKTFALVFLFVLAHFVFGSSGFAQSNKGTITGRISDSGGGILQGAQILLQPGDISRVSDAQGEFTASIREAHNS